MPQRFENLVAMALLNWVHQQQDAEGRDLDLRYFRDVDGREVDFVVTERTGPVLLVEAKWSDSGVDRNLRYLKRRFSRCRIVAAQRDGQQGRSDPGGHPPGARCDAAQRTGIG